MSKREIRISFDFIDSPAWQRAMRLAVLLTGFAGCYTLGTPANDVWWFHTAALVVTLTITSMLIRRYVMAAMDVEPGMLIHFKSLPSDVDEFTVVSWALDPDLKIWLLTIAVQGSNNRWLVWALPSEIREPNGRRELRDVHAGFSFSVAKDRSHIMALNRNVRGLSVVEA